MKFIWFIFMTKAIWKPWQKRKITPARKGWIIIEMSKVLSPFLLEPLSPLQVTTEGGKIFSKHS